MDMPVWKLRMQWDSFFSNSEYITYQWDLKGEDLVQSENKVLARPSQWHSNVHHEERELKRSRSV